MAGAAAAALRRCSGVRLRDSRYPATQRIHLLPVLMDKSIKDIFHFLCASLLIVVTAAALNFVVDPLQIFRPARLFTAMYSQDSRLQDAGLIRSQDFDAAFMGTSLAIQFRQSDIDRILRLKSLKLAMIGSSSLEQAFVLAAALTRQPKRVIWEVD